MQFRKCSKCPSVSSLKPWEVLYRMKYVKYFHGSLSIGYTVETKHSRGTHDAKDVPLKMDLLSENFGKREGVDFRVVRCHQHSVFIIVSYLFASSTDIETEFENFERIPLYYCKLMNTLFHMNLSSGYCEKTMDSVKERGLIMLTMAMPKRVLFDKALVGSINISPGQSVSADLKPIYFEPSIIEITDLSGRKTMFFSSFGFYRMSSDKWCIIFSEEIENPDSINIDEARAQLKRAADNLTQATAECIAARGNSLTKAESKKKRAQRDYKVQQAKFLASSLI